MAGKAKVMLKIGKTALLKVGDVIKASVVEGHNDEADAKRVEDFGVKVDVDALITFIGVKKAEEKPAPKKKAKSQEEPA